MSARGLAILGSVAALAYVGLRLWGDQAGLGVPDVTGPTPVNPPGDYLAKLARVESGANPNAKAPTSSASGLFQFVRSVWEALGGTWGPNPLLPFGGQAVSIEEQTARAAQLTAQNVAALADAGIPITDPNVYAAHFLGATAAIRVLLAPPSAMLSSLVSSATIAANPFLSGWTVAQFQHWLSQKMG